MFPIFRPNGRNSLFRGEFLTHRLYVFILHVLIANVDLCFKATSDWRRRERLYAGILTFGKRDI